MPRVPEYNLPKPPNPPKKNVIICSLPTNRRKVEALDRSIDRFVSKVKDKPK